MIYIYIYIYIYHLTILKPCSKFFSAPKTPRCPFFRVQSEHFENNAYIYIYIRDVIGGVTPKGGGGKMGGFAPEKAKILPIFGAEGAENG